MDNWLFFAGFTIIYGALLWWCAGRLPAERWQIAASIPIRKNPEGDWWGLNLTWYGVFVANAMAGACIMFFVLSGSLGISLFQGFLFTAPLISLCLPASHFFARWVEKKPATATIGGAYFACIIFAPWLALGIKLAFQGMLPQSFNVIPLLAAVSTSYIIGEGLGRLACISFGCCYGIPLSRGPAWARLLFRRRHFIFTGAMKKVAYESGLNGQPLVPIQIVTSIIYGAAGLAGAMLFLTGHYTAALLTTCLTGGIWRAYSETLRADFRGERKFTAYQKMALAGALYTALMPLIFPEPALAPPRIGAGLERLWTPGFLLALQALWIFTMLAMGTSKVTGATIRFHLVRSKI